MLVFFVIILFALSYGVSEFSKSNVDISVVYVNAGVEKCGCSKCHTVELNGCVGCHDSQQGKRKPNESESTVSENEIGSNESQSDSVDAPGSSPSEPDNDGVQRSEMVPNKSKNQEGSTKRNK